MKRKDQAHYAISRIVLNWNDENITLFSLVCVIFDALEHIKKHIEFLARNILLGIIGRPCGKRLNLNQQLICCWSKRNHVRSTVMRVGLAGHKAFPHHSVNRPRDGCLFLIQRMS